jgi:hypothetical protein
MEGMSDQEIEGVVCDGSGDLGIDAVRIDEDKVVHFYQFKNVEDPAKAFKEGEVDKVISGLRLILSQKHGEVANESLRAKIDDILDIVPTGYRLHLVTTGTGIDERGAASTKLDALAAELQPPSSDFFRWDCEDLKALQDRHYAKTLPAIEHPVIFEDVLPPYMIESGSSQCYMLHTTGDALARLYDKHGDLLLQRNIRVAQGDTPPNRSILATCKGNESKNFLHYNNGVTFICDSANHDPFKRTLTIHRAQVVNGGQTIRALHQAFADGSLKDDVLVPIRAVTSSGNKEFGSDVAVNQNNQNQMKPGFLRSNDPRVVQLSNALMSIGWYFERRENEAKELTGAELAGVEHRLGRSLDRHVITLQEGSQAYVATFFRHPELAKKDPKKIFLSVEDGGYFERIFSSEITAQKMVTAHQIKQYVDDFVKRFGSIKRKRARHADGWEVEYRILLGDQLFSSHLDRIDQVVPTSGFFLCATLFREYVDILKLGPDSLIDELSEIADVKISEHLCRILDYAKSNPGEANRSWPTLLKSNRFFQGFISYLTGVHAGKIGH